MFKQFQEVMLNVDSYIDTSLGEPVELKKGQRGVILDVLVMPDLPTGYNVEFFDDSGKTIGVPALEEKYLVPIHQSTHKHKRGNAAA